MTTIHHHIFCPRFPSQCFLPFVAPQIDSACLIEPKRWYHRLTYAHVHAPATQACFRNDSFYAFSDSPPSQPSTTHSNKEAQLLWVPSKLVHSLGAFHRQ
eukprot:Lithocolla_globosa_v1_NODE_7_length_11908_cov_272.203830.p11 type:complete len:100 gc:universal NODE_7_length_11908_cov_272.203830:8082-7783(-)